MENNGMNTVALTERVLDAALDHVTFDGWSTATFEAAARDAGVDLAIACVLCPRGAVDLAAAYHRRGDVAMVAGLTPARLEGLRFRDRVTLAVRSRLETADREVVRRGAALFALPTHAVDGARLIWGTADVIWRALGDTSDDINWYSKRATLSAVFSATVLFWMGDDSPGRASTWAFLDRRIEDVMRFEKLKAQVRDNPVLSRLLAGPLKFLEKVRVPATAADDLPGRTSR